MRKLPGLTLVQSLLLFVTLAASLALPAVTRAGDAPARTPDPALQPPPIDTRPGPQYADDTRIFQGIPGIERAANGRLWATWYSGGKGEGGTNYVLLVTSGDDGKTWSGPSVVIDPPGAVRAYDPCLWHDPQGRLWLFWAQSYNWWDGRSGVWAIVTDASGSESPRWSEPRRLSDGIMMNKPTVLGTGSWLMPAAIWERKATTEAAYAHDLGSRRGANVMVSNDHGGTWSFWARQPCRGACLMSTRSSSAATAACGCWYARITASARAFPPIMARPGARRRSTMPHVNSRFFIQRFGSGKLLLVTHNPPNQKTRSHLVAHLSNDDGRSWSGGLTIDERTGVSYPDGVQAADGTIYLIYDFERVGQKQILMATFTEDDVARGQWQSKAARQRVVVNQATGKPPAVGKPQDKGKPK